MSNPFDTKTNKNLNTTHNKDTDTNIQSTITGAAKGTTSMLGNATAGLANTAGGVVGAATRGLGETVTSTTGQAGKPVGDAVTNLGAGVEGAARETAEGVKKAGEWRGAE
ncbi:hypothetical protein C8A01DRAFT_36264 [Parachaetomium inaequale]|uniref:Uncharacterized protein n=1 Tax=Parachaetomium inaequale TaxID=2588326 RepID=A0AAN6PEX6_9PEZI|nr:hypothetical protein C8A01DRAFT_36264 [Parachaetomium inaequale]